MEGNGVTTDDGIRNLGFVKGCADIMNEHIYQYIPIFCLMSNWKITLGAIKSEGFGGNQDSPQRHRVRMRLHREKFCFFCVRKKNNELISVQPHPHSVSPK
jgi:hypothetical protein